MDRGLYTTVSDFVSYFVFARVGHLVLRRSTGSAPIRAVQFEGVIALEREGCVIHTALRARPPWKPVVFVYSLIPGPRIAQDFCVCGVSFARARPPRDT